MFDPDGRNVRARGLSLAATLGLAPWLRRHFGGARSEVCARLSRPTHRVAHDRGGPIDPLGGSQPPTPTGARARQFLAGIPSEWDTPGGRLPHPYRLRFRREGPNPRWQPTTA